MRLPRLFPLNGKKQRVSHANINAALAWGRSDDLFPSTNISSETRGDYLQRNEFPSLRPEMDGARGDYLVLFSICSFIGPKEDGASIVENVSGVEREKSGSVLRFE